MTEIDEDRIVVMRSYPQAALAVSYRNHSQLLSAAHYLQPKLSTKCPIFVKKCILCLSATLKEKKINTQPETVGSASSNGMKEDSVLD